VLERLTPAPGRGAVLAAGAVVLTTFALLMDIRCAHHWAVGWRLLLFGGIALLIGTLAQRTPMPQDTPLPHHQTLQVAAIAMIGLALLNLADLLGASSQFGGEGQATWVGAVVAVLALVWARRTNSAVMTLAAALLGVITLLNFVDWAFSPNSIQTFRWLLLLAALALTLGAVWLRDRARRHAVALVDIAGLSIAFLALTLLITNALAIFARLRGGDGFGGESPHSVGWKLVVLAFGFGLIAYGTVDRERVPPFLGVVLLGMFVALAGLGFNTFVGWPLVLLILAVFLLAIGLRPRDELPPEPPVHE
jgi:hypothetical protein